MVGCIIDLEVRADEGEVAGDIAVCILATAMREILRVSEASLAFEFHRAVVFRRGRRVVGAGGAEEQEDGLP